MEERTSARSKGTNRVEVPEARGALDRFKFEVANEIGVCLLYTSDAADEL